METGVIEACVIEAGRAVTWDGSEYGSAIRERCTRSVIRSCTNIL
jgi:hypothetical protein